MLFCRFLQSWSKTNHVSECNTENYNNTSRKSTNFDQSVSIISNTQGKIQIGLQNLIKLRFIISKYELKSLLLTFLGIKTIYATGCHTSPSRNKASRTFYNERLLSNLFLPDQRNLYLYTTGKYLSVRTDRFQYCPNSSLPEYKNLCVLCGNLCSGCCDCKEAKDRKKRENSVSSKNDSPCIECSTPTSSSSVSCSLTPKETYNCQQYQNRQRDYLSKDLKQYRACLARSKYRHKKSQAQLCNDLKDHKAIHYPKQRSKAKKYSKKSPRNLSLEESSSKLTDNVGIRTSNLQERILESLKNQQQSSSEEEELFQKQLPDQTLKRSQSYCSEKEAASFKRLSKEEQLELLYLPSSEKKEEIQAGEEEETKQKFSENPEQENSTSSSEKRGPVRKKSSTNRKKEKRNDRTQRTKLKSTRSTSSQSPGSKQQKIIKETRHKKDPNQRTEQIEEKERHSSLQSKLSKNKLSNKGSKKQNKDHHAKIKHIENENKEENEEELIEEKKKNEKLDHEENGKREEGKDFSGQKSEKENSERFKDETTRLPSAEERQNESRLDRLASEKKKRPDSSETGKKRPQNLRNSLGKESENISNKNTIPSPIKNKYSTQSFETKIKDSSFQHSKKTSYERQSKNLTDTYSPTSKRKHTTIRRSQISISKRKSAQNRLSRSVSRSLSQTSSRMSQRNKKHDSKMAGIIDETYTTSKDLFLLLKKGCDESTQTKIITEEIDLQTDRPVSAVTEVQTVIVFTSDKSNQTPFECNVSVVQTEIKAPVFDEETQTEAYAQQEDVQTIQRVAAVDAYIQTEAAPRTEDEEVQVPGCGEQEDALADPGLSFSRSSMFPSKKSLYKINSRFLDESTPLHSPQSRKNNIQFGEDDTQDWQAYTNDEDPETIWLKHETPDNDESDIQAAFNTGIPQQTRSSHWLRSGVAVSTHKTNKSRSINRPMTPRSPAEANMQYTKAGVSNYNVWVGRMPKENQDKDQISDEDYGSYDQPVATPPKKCQNRRPYSDYSPCSSKQEYPFPSSYPFPYHPAYPPVPYPHPFYYPGPNPRHCKCRPKSKRKKSRHCFDRSHNKLADEKTTKAEELNCLVEDEGLRDYKFAIQKTRTQILEVEETLDDWEFDDLRSHKQEENLQVKGQRVWLNPRKTQVKENIASIARRHFIREKAFCINTTQNRASDMSLDEVSNENTYTENESKSKAQFSEELLHSPKLVGKECWRLLHYNIPLAKVISKNDHQQTHENTLEQAPVQSTPLSTWTMTNDLPIPVQHDTTSSWSRTHPLATHNPNWVVTSNKSLRQTDPMFQNLSFRNP